VFTGRSGRVRSTDLLSVEERVRSVKESLLWVEDRRLYGETRVLSVEDRRLYGKRGVLSGEDQRLYGERGVLSGEDRRLYGERGVLSGEDLPLRDLRLRVLALRRELRLQRRHLLPHRPELVYPETLPRMKVPHPDNTDLAPQLGTEVLFLLLTEGESLLLKFGVSAPEELLGRSAVRRIQNAADRTGQRITVVGSRAEGTANPFSDWDYILSGRLGAPEHMAVLQKLGLFAVEAGATSSDAAAAVQRAHLKPTLTPCVLLNSGALKVQIAKVIGLPAAERGKSFRLLLALFEIADARRRSTSCVNGCAHWWHAAIQRA
jgi:hypothetical protein